MAWFNPGVKVKPGSQLINKLVDSCSYIWPRFDLWTAIVALCLPPRAVMAALRPLPRPYQYKQSLINIAIM